MEYDHRIVVHDETYVSSGGIHINQAKRLFSLVKPWLRKFRGLFEAPLGQAAHTFGIICSLNLGDASFEIVVNCLAMGAFLDST
jgi:hypothetical protein